MRVFAVFTERDAGLVKVWARSWAAQGFDPKLISPREVVSRSLERAVARRGLGRITRLTCINFSARPRHTKHTSRFKRRGWQKADIVEFPHGTTEETVLNCGRPLA